MHFLHTFSSDLCRILFTVIVFFVLLLVSEYDIDEQLMAQIPEVPGLLGMRKMTWAEQNAAGVKVGNFVRSDHEAVKVPPLDSSSANATPEPPQSGSATSPAPGSSPSSGFLGSLGSLGSMFGGASSGAVSSPGPVPAQNHSSGFLGSLGSMFGGASSTVAVAPAPSSPQVPRPV